MFNILSNMGNNFILHVTPIREDLRAIKRLRVKKL